jgi:hypothetical protein
MFVTGWSPAQQHRRLPHTVVLYRAIALDDALAARQHVRHWTAPLHLGSTIAFLINVILHSIFGWRPLLRHLFTVVTPVVIL